MLDQTRLIPLFSLPWSEARALLAGGAPVYLLANPVEYHGPHLSLRNDALVAEGLMCDLHARLARTHPDWPLLVAAPIEAGADPVPAPGSRRTPYSVFRPLVLEACASLLEMGARRVVLMTFHGSPLHGLALGEAVRWLAARGVQALAPLNLAMGEMLDLDASRFAEILEHVEDEAEREEMLREMRFDFHGGFLETSVALYYAPGSVSPVHRSLPPCPRIVPERRVAAASRIARALGRRRLGRELEIAADFIGWYSLRPFPGYTGRPHRATAEAGAIFARFMVERFAGWAEEVFSGRMRPPLPPLSWLGRATLGGRIGRVRALRAGAILQG